VPRVLYQRRWPVTLGDSRRAVAVILYPFDSRGGQMPAAIAVTRTDYTAVELRRAAARTNDGNAARRMLAIAHVLDGKTREEAAATCGMDRQTLRDWVHRYNAEGVDGLHDRVCPGPQPRLSREQEAEVAQWVREGPSLAAHGVVRWRRVDLARLIEQRFGVTFAERSVGSLLRRLGFRRLSVRPRHPDKDAAQEAFKKTLPIWSQKASRSARATSRSRSGGRTKRASVSKAR
jgi:transposase